jgi:hypothetical protein
VRYAPRIIGSCADGILTGLLTTYLIRLGDGMITQLSKSPNRGILKHGLGSPSWRLSDTIKGKAVRLGGKRKQTPRLAPSQVSKIIKAHNLELERELRLADRRDEFLKQHAKPAEQYN